MKLAGRPQNPVQWLAKKLGLMPPPLLDPHIAMLLARAVMEGTRLGVFEALAAGPLAADEIGSRCGSPPPATRKLPPPPAPATRGATRKLLDALAGCEYLRFDASSRYGLTLMARKWLLADAPQSL